MPILEEEISDQLFMRFKKEVDGKLTSLIVVDNVFDKTSLMNVFNNYARAKNFKVC